MAGDELAVVLDQHLGRRRRSPRPRGRSARVGPSSGPSRSGPWPACRPCGAHRDATAAAATATAAAASAPRSSRSSGTAAIVECSRRVDLDAPRPARVVRVVVARPSAPAGTIRSVLRVAAQRLDHALRLGVGGLAEVGPEPEVRGEPHVVRGRDHHVGDDPALQAAHPIGEHHLRGRRRAPRSTPPAAASSWRPSGRGRRARTATGSRPAPRRTPASRPRSPSRSPGARPASAPTAGTPAAAAATAPSPPRPRGGSSGPTPRSPQPAPTGSSRFAEIRPSVARTFSAITSRTHVGVRAPPCRRGAVRAARRPGSRSTTRFTVLWVVPHNAAAPR